MVFDVSERDSNYQKGELIWHVPHEYGSSLISPDHLSLHIRADAVAYALGGEQIHPPSR